MKRILIGITLLSATFIFSLIFPIAVNAMDYITIKESALELEYDWIFSFSEGLASVQKGSKYGYIDRTGKEVIPFEYDYCYGFSEGLARVIKDDKWGYIDKAGKVVVPFEYRAAEPFKEGMAAVSENWEGQYGRGSFINWGFVDKIGEIVIPCEYSQATSFSEGLAAVRKDGKWGYIDKTGEVIIPFAYDRADNFKEGLALVSVWDTQYKDNYGYIDKTGKIVVPLEYDLANGFSGGLAGVMKSNKSGYIDKTGDVVIPLIYDSFNRSFSEGLANVKKDGKWGYIDKVGKTAIPFEYNYTEAFKDGMAVVANEHGKYDFIDKTGKLVTSREYYQVSEFKDGLALVRKDDEESQYGKNGIYNSDDFKAYWGYIDKTGDVVIPIEYSDSETLSGGLIPMRKDGKWSIFQIIITKDIEVTFGATKYILNGEPFEQQTLLYDGVAYLPAAYLATKLKLTAQWDAVTNITTITSIEEKTVDDSVNSSVSAADPISKIITVTFGSTSYILNGEPFDQDTMVYNGIAYLPAAYLAEKLGLVAIWDSETNTTTLTISSE